MGSAENVKAMQIHILYVWEHVNMSNPDILGNLEKQDVYSPQVVAVLLTRRPYYVRCLIH